MHNDKHVCKQAHLTQCTNHQGQYTQEAWMNNNMVVLTCSSRSSWRGTGRMKTSQHLARRRQQPLVAAPPLKVKDTRVCSFSNLIDNNCIGNDTSLLLPWTKKKKKKEPLRIHTQNGPVAILLLYSKKISSAKNFVKNNRPAVRQEYIFVKRRSSLVALRSFGRCFVAYRWFSHSWIFLIPHL